MSSANDLQNVTMSDIDSVSKHFLYLILDENSREKKILDVLQNQIEELQCVRYDLGESNATTKYGITDDEEQTLVKKRDEILDGLFESCLRLMIDIANKPEVMEHLKDYCSPKDHETECYGPYVLLCNQALQLLADLGGNLPFRKPSTLDIRFVRSTKSGYGEADAVMRKPDVGTTSRVAAYDVAGNIAESCFAKLPSKEMTWPQLLMGSEFRLQDKDLSPKFKKRFEKGFSDTARQITIDHVSLENKFDFVPSPDSESDDEFTQSENVLSPCAQCSSYGIDMLSNCLGIHHAIILLIIDDLLCVWYYDRQGIIQSDGMSFIDDLPRVLVLLFAFQRFTLKDWGVIPQLNPNAIHVHQLQQLHSDQKIKISVDITALENYYIHNMISTVELDPNDFFRKPRSLSGRATSVLGSEGAIPGDPGKVSMVCKIYHPEVQRRHEGTTLQIVRNIAETEDGAMSKHLPTLYFYGDVPECTTHRIRSLLNLKWKGHRTLRIIGLKKLDEITTTEGQDFVKAWFEVVTCHSFLWKNRVEHGDPSVSNMMYDPELKCGVLTDFDLSILRWEPRVPGTDCTGTIPFMALGILNRGYWEGRVQRRHYHELESFTWILAFFFLRYHGDKRHIDPWTTYNYEQCFSAKKTFLDVERLKIATDTIGLKSPKALEFRKFVRNLCMCVSRCNWERDIRLNDLYERDSTSVVSNPYHDSDSEGYLEIENQRGSIDEAAGGRSHLVDFPGLAGGGSIPTPGLDFSQQTYIEDCEISWTYFITALQNFVQSCDATSVFIDMLTRLKTYKPAFEDLTQEEVRNFQEKFSFFGGCSSSPLNFS